MALHIRPAQTGDRDALSRVCLLTADSGSDASALYSDPTYPGLVWSVPYLDFAPDHAFVLADGADVIGYVVGTPNTATFETRLDVDWWPALRTIYAGRNAILPRDAGVLDRIRHPRHSDPAIVAAYPAHLHINILPPAQSGGWGRKLIDTALRSFQRAGAKGVHLGLGLTNERAFGFYQHIGFTEISRGEGILMGQDL